MTTTDLRQASRIFLTEMAHLKSLRGLNILAALVHTAIIFLFFTINIHYSLPIFSYGPPAEDSNRISAIVQAGSVDIFILVVAYLAVAAIFHLLIGTVLFHRYTDYMKQHRNPLRWLEYSISCSLMLVALSLAAGISHIEILFAIFIVSSAMSFSGLVFENVNRKTHSVIWSPFVLGCILGAVPWVLIFSMVYALAGSPAELISQAFLLYVVTFVIFLLFPINAYLSAKHIGAWKSYVTAEMGYISLSFVAKIFLAMLLYFNLVALI